MMAAAVVVGGRRREHLTHRRRVWPPTTAPGGSETVTLSLPGALQFRDQPTCRLSGARDGTRAGANVRARLNELRELHMFRVPK